VIQRALDDLDPDPQGFSGCTAAQRKRWKVDAEDFFENLRYRVFAEAAGFQPHEIESLYEIKCAERLDSEKSPGK
jgi:hypothetical protein